MSDSFLRIRGEKQSPLVEIYNKRAFFTQKAERLSEAPAATTVATNTMDNSLQHADMFKQK